MGTKATAQSDRWELRRTFRAATIVKRLAPYVMLDPRSKRGRKSTMVHRTRHAILVPGLGNKWWRGQDWALYVRTVCGINTGGVAWYQEPPTGTHPCPKCDEMSPGIERSGVELIVPRS